MKILIAGANGYIGSHLVTHLESKGHTVLKLVRKRKQPDDILWEPDDLYIEAEKLEGMDVVINVAGESINKMWSRKNQTAIKASRIRSTELLIHTFKGLKSRPKAFLCASAVGFYGANSGERVMNEDDIPDVNPEEFLANLCRTWEFTAHNAEHLGIRVCTTRFGVVLGKGSELIKMMNILLKVKTVVQIGDGKNYLSWIHIDDLCAAMSFVVDYWGIRNRVNVASPNSVQMTEFLQSVRMITGAKLFFRIPPAILQLFMGSHRVKEIYQASQRVAPEKLLKAGFEFKYPNISQALKDIYS